jgi:DNA-binding NtrC family response regulator
LLHAAGERHSRRSPAGFASFAPPPPCRFHVCQGESSLVPAVILVVDDDDPVRVMLARLLRTQGYSVLQAANASEARRLIGAERPDLIISDIVMPGESGIELRRHVAGIWPELPVILISGYSAEGPAEFASRTANTIFVQKPFAADQLLTLVERTLAAPQQSEL